MKNDIYEGPIKNLLDKYDSKNIDLDSLGTALLEEVAAGGDVAYVEPTVYEAILKANGTPRKVDNSYVGDALLCSLVGCSFEIQLPRPRGTFNSFNRKAVWEDPKWLSGVFAWRESARRRYIDTVTNKEISEATLRDIRSGAVRDIRHSDIKMIVTWEGVPSARAIDVLIWKQYDDKDELIVIHHVLFVQGVPVYSFLDDRTEAENSVHGTDTPVTVDTVIDGLKTVYTVKVLGSVIGVYEGTGNRFEKVS